jgi:hypothetical protein
MRRSRIIFRTLSDRTTVAPHCQLRCHSKGIGLQHEPIGRGKARLCDRENGFLGRTFIFADVFKSKCAIGVFAFDNADFAECAFADNAE